MLHMNSGLEFGRFLDEKNKSTAAGADLELVKLVLYLDTMTDQIAHALKWSDVNPEISKHILENLHTYDFSIAVSKSLDALKANIEFRAQLRDTIKDGLKAAMKLVTELSQDDDDDDSRPKNPDKGSTPDGICSIFGCKEEDCELCNSIDALRRETGQDIDGRCFDEPVVAFTREDLDRLGFSFGPTEEKQEL